MIGINGKDWHELTSEDIETFLASSDSEESFYFEFKDDRVDPKKVTEEISALANTFGGYIFFGVSDSHGIEGCSDWDEQRITTTLHNNISPTPSFDIKKFVINDKTIYVLKIDEGAEPPYITNKGKIYERLSSSACVVNDSARLTQMINKHEAQLNRMERRIFIDPASDQINNVFGYIDLGFVLVTKDNRAAFDLFNSTNTEQLMKTIISKSPNKNFSQIGHSYFFTPGDISSKENKLPAHLNNFMEIMADGSARMRVLLVSNDPYKTTVYMMRPFEVFIVYEDVYSRIMGNLFPNQFVYAKKYESLTVLKQFQPVFSYDPSMLAGNEKMKKQNDMMAEKTLKKRAIFGKDIVITSTRLPKTGLSTIDKQMMQLSGFSEYTSESIIDLLFHSEFAIMGMPSE